MKNTVLGIVALVSVVAIVVVGILFAAGVNIFSAKVNAHVAKATLNSKVTSAVYNANNKIQSQGYFESLYADYKGFLSKISIQKSLTKADPSPYNQTNLAGIQQECVDTTQQYNAAARSISSEIFRSEDLPVSLNSQLCTR